MKKLDPSLYVVKYIHVSLFYIGPSEQRYNYYSSLIKTTNDTVLDK